MRVAPVLVLVAIVVGLVAAPAGAATTIVRPNATTSVDLAWGISAAGKTADAVLADQLVRTATPAPTSDRLIAGFGPGSARVSFPAVTLPAGASVTGATAWIYSSVGLLQLLTPSLWSGADRLATTTWASSSAAWRSIAITPTPAQLAGGLALDLRTDGLIGITNSTVYAAYLQVDATTPDRAPAAGALPAAVPDEPAGDDPAAADETQGAAPGAVAIVTPASVELPAAATALPVDVGCPADAGGPCRGRVRIELLAGAAKARGKKARAARCARGCRVLGDTAFTVAAGKKRAVRVRLRTAAYKLLPRGRTVKVRVTVSSRDHSGHATSVARVIAIHRARK